MFAKLLVGWALLVLGFCFGYLLGKDKAEAIAYAIMFALAASPFIFIAAIIYHAINAKRKKAAKDREAGRVEAYVITPKSSKNGNQIVKVSGNPKTTVRDVSKR